MKINNIIQFLIAAIILQQLHVSILLYIS